MLASRSARTGAPAPEPGGPPRAAARARRGTMAGTALAVAALAAGCSASQPARSPATVATCYAFALQALDQHVTVTTMPRPAVAWLMSR
jgi:hypothetical protein